jgi:hypothetical protein
VVKLTPAWRELYRKVVRLELRLTAHATGLRVTAGKAGDLGVRLVAHAARLRTTAARAGVEGFRLVAHAARLRVTADRAGLERVRLDAHAVRLRLTAAKAGLLSLILTKLSGLLIKTSADAANILAPAAHTVSTKLLTLVAPVKTLSAKAAEVATTLSNATLSPHKPGKLIGTKQIGGGAKLDAAVGKLDAAISETAAKVDNAYAYLTALNKRAAENKLPAGDAKGATAQVGAFVYSVSGANNTAHQTHLAIFIGGFLLVIGLGFGIALYRIRRGLPSSMAPPKSSGAAA